MAKLSRNKYNAAGNLLQQIDPLSNTTNFEYDLLGRQTKTIDPLNNQSETVYHATTGRVSSQKDAKGVSMTFTYNPLGQVLTSTDRAAKVTTNTYNNMGQVATVTDAESRTTAYGYNLLGARNSLTFSDTGVQTVNTFDGAGRPLEITSPSGRKQNVTYNFLGNVTQVQFKNSGETVTETQAMTYDDYGRETATSSSQYSASTAKTYNDRGQLATEATTYSGQTYTVSYTYDSQGRPIKLTYPSGREAEYTYDDRQLLKTIKWETAQIEDRSYNDAGMLTGVDRTYVDETRTYNAGSQLTEISNTNVGSQTYTYDANGNVLSETLSGNMANYSFTTEHSGGPFADGYDAEDRFMRFKRSGVSENILLTRSDIGNISNVDLNGTNTARGYNNAHGLTSVGATSQTFDTDGNTTTLHTAVTAAWDDAGRMKNTDVPLGASAGQQGLNEYGYVGSTRIWKKITRRSNVVEHRVYIHAGPNLVAEYNAGVAASTPVQEYVYAGEIDSLVMIRRSDATKYGVTRNRQWSITALHDMANGDVVERYAYEMTGKRIIYAANGTTVRTKSSYGNHFGYTNRWHDEDSGLMYFRARYYNPLTGEFLSRDPMEFIDGMSLYRGYFSISNSDPFGALTFIVKEVRKVGSGRCGGFMHVIEWQIDPKSEKDGFIVQKVCYEHEMQQCEELGEKECVGPKNWGPPLNQDKCNCYIEVWRVSNKVIHVDVVKPGTKSKKTDTFGLFDCPNTFGSFSQTGEALFIPLADAEAHPELDPRPLIHQGANGAQWAHSLYSACLHRPGVTEFWNRALAKYGIATTRKSSMIWWCCDKWPCYNYNSSFETAGDKQHGLHGDNTPIEQNFIGRKP